MHIDQIIDKVLDALHNDIEEGSLAPRRLIETIPKWLLLEYLEENE